MTTFLTQQKEKRKYVAGLEIEPRPLAYESDVLPTVLRCPASTVSYNPRLRLTVFYQSYGPLSVLSILSTEVLVSATPPTFLRDFDETFQLLFS